MSLRKIQIIIGVIGILLPVLTLFIPFYESVLMIDKNEIPGLLYTYEEIEVGDIAVISGLGSFYAFVNIPLSIVLSIMLIINQPNLPTVITLASFFALCNLLVFVGCSAGFGKPFGDSMLLGYQTLVLTELVLISFSIYAAIQNKVQKDQTTIDF